VFKQIALVCTVAALVGVAGTAGAAAPPSGTLSKTRRTLTWKGGPYTTSYPTSDVQCLNGQADTMCDHFYLKIDMGQGALIRVSITPSASGLEALQVVAGPNDFDLFVYSPDGALVGQSAGSTGYESVTFAHKAIYRNRPYEVRVVPFLVVPGATYKGTARTITYVK
jgi:hypothetical protein